MPKNTINILSDDDLETLRSVYDGTDLRIGTFNFETESRSVFFGRFNSQVTRMRSRIDAIVMSQHYLRGRFEKDTLIKETMELLKRGMNDDTQLVIMDENGDINERGIEFFDSKGIEIVNDIVSLCEYLNKAFDIDNAHMSALPGMDASQYDDDTDDNSAVFGRVKVAGTDTDPFESIRNADADDSASVYAQIARQDGILFKDEPDGDFDDPFDDDEADQPDFYDDGTDVEQEQPDPFATIRGDTEETPSVSMDDLMPMSDMDDDGTEQDGQSNALVEVDPATRFDGFSGEGSREDMDKLIPTYEDPSWDYSEINAGIAESKGLFGKKSKKGGRIIGETSDAMQYANSQYISDIVDKYGGYNPPNECKIVVCYSNVGGSGKTTIATMIGAQLVWYFDRELLQRRTANMAHRVLVLSFNEFDDITIKGVGEPNIAQALDEAETTPNILTLKHRIEEHGGEPEWDDIVDCFKFNPANYVMYVSPMTMKQKFESGGEEITDTDYAKILTVCKRFFDFIIIDTPDVFYDQRNGLMAFAFRSADIQCIIINPDNKSLTHLYTFINGLRAGNRGKIPFNRNQSMLIVNKVIEGNNPYIGHSNGHQVSFKNIANTYTKLFYKVIAVPYTDPLMDENIMFGYDSKVKVAAATITDTVLEMIDKHDHTNGQ